MNPSSGDKKVAYVKSTAVKKEFDADGGVIYTNLPKDAKETFKNTAMHIHGEEAHSKEPQAEGGVVYTHLPKDAKDHFNKPAVEHKEEAQPKPKEEEHIDHEHKEQPAQYETTNLTDDTTKTEEQKPEETKPEEPAQEEPKQEEPKQEETKPEEPQVEEKKPEEPQPEEKKPEETKESVPTGKAEEVKVEIIDTGAKLETPLFTGDDLKGMDMKTFLMSPAPKGYIVQCSIKREKGGLLSYPKYFLSLSHKPVYLMGAKKQGGNKTSNYAVTMSEKDFSKKAAGYLGKVRANFLGTEFNIWSPGENPSKAKSPAEVREQLGAVLYEASLLGSGPRKMKILIPEVKPDGDIVRFKPNSEKEGIVHDYQSGKTEGFKVYTNKAPKWNEKVQAFVLNFHGRVQKASVKNFQIADEHDDKVLLQFGRTDDTHFIMDFQYPLSPFQAFSICLTSFDYKLACE